MEKEKSTLYQLQTKLYQVEDVLVTFGPLRLTLRQCMVLVLGGCISMDVWRSLGSFVALGEAGVIIQWIIVSIPLLITLLITVLRVADRYTEHWVLVFYRYATTPSLYLWSPYRPARSQSRRSTARRARQQKNKSRTHKETHA